MNETFSNTGPVASPGDLGRGGGMEWWCVAACASKMTPDPAVAIMLCTIAAPGYGQRMTIARRKRRSARIILLDDAGRVLLIRFLIERSGGAYGFWATPGGEIEPGEAPLDAAHRELGEELGLALPLSGPVHQASGVFEFKSETVDNIDTFYAAAFAGGAITLGGVDDGERSVLKEIRWWTADGIDAASEPIYPPDLAAVVRRLIVEKATPV